MSESSTRLQNFIDNELVLRRPPLKKKHFFQLHDWPAGKEILPSLPVTFLATLAIVSGQADRLHKLALWRDLPLLGTKVCSNDRISPSVQISFLIGSLRFGMWP